ncbi:MAG: fatty acid desaturase [Parvularculaceae bacterium]
MAEQTVNSFRDLKLLARTETRGFQWPTLVLSATVISMTLLSTWLAVTDRIPMLVAMVINTFFMAQGYTAVHECAHRNMNGRHKKLNWVNDVFGCAGFVFTLHSFTVHSHVHRLHHSDINDIRRDTDAWVSEAPNFWNALARSLVFYFYTHWYFFKIYPLIANKRKFLIRAFLETAIPFGIAIWLSAIGYGREVLLLWVIPTILTFSVVSMMIDWIPHHVPEHISDIDHTLIRVPSKTWRGWLMKWAYGFHNYHLIHHLVPNVPWYAQERTFEKAEAFLKANGARIKYPDERGAQAAPMPAE